MQTDDNVIDISIEPKRFPAIQGWYWIVQAFRLFGAHWMVFLPQSLLFTLLALASALIPLAVFPFVVITPMLIAGMCHSAAKAAAKEPPKLGHLFVGLKIQTKPLLRLGMIYLIAILIISSVFYLGAQWLDVDTLIQAIAAAQTGEQVEINPDSALYLLGLMFVCWLLIQNLFYFAPPAVILHGIAPAEAVQVGMSAFWRNLAPLALAALIFCAMAAVASVLLPAMLILLPVAILFNYTSYADIFALSTRSE